MREILFIAMIAGLAIGFAVERQEATAAPPEDVWEYTHDCMNGVSYYVIGNRMAPEFSRNGNIVLCGD